MLVVSVMVAPESQTTGPFFCQVPDCFDRTREGKPWCAEHVHTHSPYVVDLRADLEQAELEAQGAPIDLDGLI